MDGAGEGEDVDARGFVLQQEARDFFEGCARVEEVIHKKDLFACYAAVDGVIFLSQMRPPHYRAFAEGCAFLFAVLFGESS